MGPVGSRGYSSDLWNNELSGKSFLSFSCFFIVFVLALVSVRSILV